MFHYRILLPIVLGLFSLNTMAADDLMQAYERVVVSNLDATAVQKELDLDRQDVSAFMLSRMNALPKKGDGACPEEVMGRMVSANPGKGIEWLLDRYGQLSAVGRANMAKSLRHSECKEAYEVVSTLLINKEEVVNQHAAAVAAGPYTHLRVCDYAYSSLLWMVQKGAGLPADLPNGLFSDTSIETRDQAINRLLDWWSKESAKMLEQKASIGTARPSVKEKIRLLRDTKP